MAKYKHHVEAQHYGIDVSVDVESERTGAAQDVTTVIFTGGDSFINQPTFKIEFSGNLERGAMAEAFKRAADLLQLE